MLSLLFSLFGGSDIGGLVLRDPFPNTGLRFPESVRRFVYCVRIRFGHTKAPPRPSSGTYSSYPSASFYLPFSVFSPPSHCLFLTFFVFFHFFSQNICILHQKVLLLHPILYPINAGDSRVIHG